MVRFEGELASGSSVRDALAGAATALMEAALDRGSRDNITVLCVDLRPADASAEATDVGHSAVVPLAASSAPVIAVCMDLQSEFVTP